MIVFYQINGRVAIIQKWYAPDHKEFSWDIYTPPCMSAEVDATFAAAEASLGLSQGSEIGDSAQTEGGQ